ncbi:hypothetical protein [Streptomyces sp. URMC 129]|uniref:hypothetical protein n=1 Tax=Streptomyces sp. URMC 129 TaxID=3423407 RepID=UPI003F1BE141
MTEEPPDSSANLPDDWLARRVKALACTAPLQALEENKRSLGRLAAEPYQMVELALHTIDQVAIIVVFNSGAEHDTVIKRVGKFATVQAPEQQEAEHGEVAAWVLRKLIDIGHRPGKSHGSTGGSTRRVPTVATNSSSS